MRNKEWYRHLFRRRALVVLLILLQLVFIIYLTVSSSSLSGAVNTALTVISVLVTLYIVGYLDYTPYKLIWVFVILSFPVFGGLLYLLFQLQSHKRATNKRLTETAARCRPIFGEREECLSELADEYPEYHPLAKYLSDCAGFPAYDHTQTEYMPSGEQYFAAILTELEKAEKYIFIESFIIQEGKMWDSILSVLKRKVESGVEVRVLYDDMGCFLRIPMNYNMILESYGIQCRVFNPFRAFLSTLQNNRDHRKIISVDGVTAFCGGINLADEYINEVRKLGHWNDSAVMLKGDAAWSLTLCFLELWDPDPDMSAAFLTYRPDVFPNLSLDSDGFVLPFVDSPIDNERVSRNVYLRMLTTARNRVYITTPYLIIDENMMTALELAAKSGVDVRIITPYHSDKWYVHATTRSYYHILLSYGVKIYEYLPGFIHAKTVVCDGTSAFVGSVNFDYRSLYLHFESGVLMCGSRAVSEAESNFLTILPMCREITAKDAHNGFFMRMLKSVLQLLAPLM